MTDSWRPVEKRPKCHAPAILPTILLSAICFLLTSPGSVVAAEAIMLRVGEVRIFQVAPSVRVVIGNGRVIASERTANDLMISGVSPGFSTLNIGPEPYSVTVLSPGEDADNRRAALERLLQRVEGVEVLAEAGQVIVDGSLLLEHDLERVRALCQLFGATNLTRMEERILAPRKMVRLSVRLAEVRQDASHELGLNWERGVFTMVLDALTLANGLHAFRASVPGSLSFGEVLPESSSAGGAIIKLDGRDERVRVLESYELLVVNGQTDEYASGGRLLIPVSGVMNGDIKEVNYGMSIRVTPRADGQGLIHLDLDYDISALQGIDSSKTYNFSRQAQKTQVMLREGQTLAIGGFQQSVLGRQHRGVPFMARLPLVGVLFGTQAASGRRGQAVVFITPQVEQSGGPQADQPLLRSTLNDALEEQSYVPLLDATREADARAGGMLKALPQGR